MALTDVTAHSHIECDFWISTFWWETVSLPILMRLFWLLMTSVIIFLKLRISRRCDRQKTKCTGPHYVLVESCTSQLTSLPMQRCCPTPFSHLWCRLILQALQRRPCFAVFPARNTTCLAVVPGNTQEKRTHAQVQPCRVLGVAGVSIKWTANYAQSGRGCGKNWSRLYLCLRSLFSSMNREEPVEQRVENVTHDVDFCKDVFDQNMPHHHRQSKPFQTPACMKLVFTSQHVTELLKPIWVNRNCLQDKLQLQR